MAQPAKKKRLSELVAECQKRINRVKEFQNVLTGSTEFLSGEKVNNWFGPTVKPGSALPGQTVLKFFCACAVSTCAYNLSFISMY